jgi:hypothetical protein
MGSPKPKPEQATVPNPRLGELHQALVSAKPVANSCDHALDGLVAALKQNAWTGTAKADAFGAELNANVKNARAGADGCIANLHAAIANCPATVSRADSGPSMGRTAT